MDNTGYTTLTRQTGLLREMQTVAHNIANISTTGYRAQGVIFSEYLQPSEGPLGSVSMATANVRKTDLSQGPLTQTNGTFDLAIEGPGFFLLDTPNGERLTRAGAFLPDDAGELVSPDGHRLLDIGGAPVFVPPDAASVGVAADGTLSVNGQAIAQIGLFAPPSPDALTREGGTLFVSADGIEPVENGAILQGFVEASNVDAVGQMARMIEVQHAYELGQSFLEREDERLRGLIRTLGS
ncbi:flagellar hook-basal body complex protein [Actibacterium sp. XHP0104]|uniref:flagellar hook-basal body complex protein n=1 Tax=Actibacterium sp. XHP0104 TaxID=2984335 RepID=UPI0021E7EB7D|nr:flagellar hook-basal body complex protein [Actibacterium sp. XHP0104]MCV2881803.1 flagellar hook-basal body complex protein [Actibacterium sp. XHP0104]